MRRLMNSKNLILIAFIFGFIGSAYADNVAKATQDIPKETFAKIASDCKKKYEDLLDSGITAKMREGAVNHGDCLLESIEKYADGFFDKQQKKILFDQIKSARQTYFSINDIIAQNNIACDNGYCGTMQSLFAYAFDIEMLEGILHRLIEARYLHKNDIKAFDWDLN